MFVLIQDGDYAVNTNHIVSLAIGNMVVTLTMSSGESFDIDDEGEIAALMKALGL